MKKIILLSITIFGVIISKGQNNPGYLQVGFHAALPQNELKKAEYDNGGGFQLGYFTRGLSLSKESAYSIRGGFEMDFDWMNRKKFDVLLNTPVPDHGNLEVYNSSFGFYMVLRNQFEAGKVSYYGDLVFGGRNYTTSQSITAKNPFLNPQYESSSTAPDVVVTNKPQAGFGGGVLFKLTGNVYTDLGFTYCMGPEGLVQPLKDVTQEGNEIHYNPKKVDTDILLIKASITFLIRKPEYQSPTYQTPNQSPSYETQEIRRNNPPPRNPTPHQPTPEPKKPLEIKPNTPAPKKKIDY